LSHLKTTDVHWQFLSSVKSAAFNNTSLMFNFAPLSYMCYAFVIQHNLESFTQNFHTYITGLHFWFTFAIFSKSC